MKFIAGSLPAVVLAVLISWPLVHTTVADKSTTGSSKDSSSSTEQPPTSTESYILLDYYPPFIGNQIIALTEILYQGWVLGRTVILPEILLGLYSQVVKDVVKWTHTVETRQPLQVIFSNNPTLGCHDPTHRPSDAVREDVEPSESKAPDINFKKNTSKWNPQRSSQRTVMIDLSGQGRDGPMRFSINTDIDDNNMYDENSAMEIAGRFPRFWNSWCFFYRRLIPDLVGKAALNRHWTQDVRENFLRKMEKEKLEKKTIRDIRMAALIEHDFDRDLKTSKKLLEDQTAEVLYFWEKEHGILPMYREETVIMGEEGIIARFDKGVEKKVEEVLSAEDTETSGNSFEKRKSILEELFHLRKLRPPPKDLLPSHFVSHTDGESESIRSSTENTNEEDFDGKCFDPIYRKPFDPFVVLDDDSNLSVSGAVPLYKAINASSIKTAGWNADPWTYKRPCYWKFLKAMKDEKCLFLKHSWNPVFAMSNIEEYFASNDDQVEAMNQLGIKRHDTKQDEAEILANELTDKDATLHSHGSDNVLAPRIAKKFRNTIYLSLWKSVIETAFPANKINKESAKLQSFLQAARSFTPDGFRYVAAQEVESLLMIHALLFDRKICGVHMRSLFGFTTTEFIVEKCEHELGKNPGGSGRHLVFLAGDDAKRPHIMRMKKRLMLEYNYFVLDSGDTGVWAEKLGKTIVDKWKNRGSSLPPLLMYLLIMRGDVDVAEGETDNNEYKGSPPNAKVSTVQESISDHVKELQFGAQQARLGKAPDLGLFLDIFLMVRYCTVFVGNRRSTIFWLVSKLRDVVYRDLSEKTVDLGAEDEKQEKITDREQTQGYVEEKGRCIFDHPINQNKGKSVTLPGAFGSLDGTSVWGSEYYKRDVWSWLKTLGQIVTVKRGERAWVLREYDKSRGKQIIAEQLAAQHRMNATSLEKVSYAARNGFVQETEPAQALLSSLHLQKEYYLGSHRESFQEFAHLVIFGEHEYNRQLHEGKKEALFDSVGIRNWLDARDFSYPGSFGVFGYFTCWYKLRKQVTTEVINRGQGDKSKWISLHDYLTWIRNYIFKNVVLKAAPAHLDSIWLGYEEERKQLLKEKHSEFNPDYLTSLGPGVPSKVHDRLAKIRTYLDRILRDHGLRFQKLGQRVQHAWDADLMFHNVKIAEEMEFSATGLLVEKPNAGSTRYRDKIWYHDSIFILPYREQERTYARYWKTGGKGDQSGGEWWMKEEENNEAKGASVRADVKDNRYFSYAEDFFDSVFQRHFRHMLGFGLVQPKGVRGSHGERYITDQQVADYRKRTTQHLHWRDRRNKVMNRTSYSIFDGPFDLPDDPDPPRNLSPLHRPDWSLNEVHMAVNGFAGVTGEYAMGMYWLIYLKYIILFIREANYSEKECRKELGIFGQATSTFFWLNFGYVTSNSRSPVSFGGEMFADPEIGALINMLGLVFDGRSEELYVEQKLKQKRFAGGELKGHTSSTNSTGERSAERTDIFRKLWLGSQNSIDAVPEMSQDTETFFNERRGQSEMFKSLGTTAWMIKDGVSDYLEKTRCEPQWTASEVPITYRDVNRKRKPRDNSAQNFISMLLQDYILDVATRRSVERLEMSSEMKAFPFRRYNIRNDNTENESDPGVMFRTVYEGAERDVMENVKGSVSQEKSQYRSMSFLREASVRIHPGSQRLWALFQDVWFYKRESNSGSSKDPWISDNRIAGSMLMNSTVLSYRWCSHNEIIQSSEITQRMGHGSTSGQERETNICPLFDPLYDNMHDKVDVVNDPCVKIGMYDNRSGMLNDDFIHCLITSPEASTLQHEHSRFASNAKIPVSSTLFEKNSKGTARINQHWIDFSLLVQVLNLSERYVEMGIRWDPR